MWFDGEDPGFAEAGSIKVALQMKLSPLGNGRMVAFVKRLVGSANLLFVVLRAMSTNCRRWNWDVDNVRPFMGCSFGYHVASRQYQAG